MRHTIYITLLLACSALVAEEPLQIPVVHTWKELSATPEIKLKDGQKVHIGIEALTAPTGSRVLLYVLGGDGDTDEFDTSHVGPLKLRIEPDENVDPLLRARQAVDRMDPGIAPLFCALIAVREKASTLSLLDGTTVVATAQVTSSGRTYQPWFELCNAEDKELEEFDKSMPVVVSVSSGGEAWPSIDTDEPLCYVSAEQLNGRETLPRLLTPDDVEQIADADHHLAAMVADLESDFFDDRLNATEALQHQGPACMQLLSEKRLLATDPESRLRLDKLISDLTGSILAERCNDSVLLKFPFSIDPEEICDHLVARWWVNGKPVLPHPQEISRFLMAKKAAQLAAICAVKLHTDRFPALLGAKPGDRITAQFMYSSKELLSNNQLRRAMEVLRDSEEATPCVSNKVEWVVP